MTGLGLFIVLEGPNGAGKSTFKRKLARALVRRGASCKFAREPSRRDTGQLVRRYRDKPADHALTLACLLAADRYENLVEIVEPGVSEGCVVISDRYLLSMLVYQSLDGLSYDFIRELNHGIRTPDFTFVLDTPLSVAMARIERRKSSTRSENPQRLRDEYEMYSQMTPRLTEFGHPFGFWGTGRKDVRRAAELIISKLQDQSSRP